MLVDEIKNCYFQAAKDKKNKTEKPQNTLERDFVVKTKKEVS